MTASQNYYLAVDMQEKLNNKIFNVISEVSDNLNQKTFVIGGFVRDMYLQRPSKDIDVVTLGSGIELARQVLPPLTLNQVLLFLRILVLRISATGTMK